MIPKETILNALNWRYAAKIFNPKEKVSADDIHAILESARLAPSAFGVEPWKFILVENTDVRAKLRAASFDQPKVTDAAAIIVIARRTDVREAATNELIERTSLVQGQPSETYTGLRTMLDASIARQSDSGLDAWAKAQCYIPLGIMIETTALLGLDGGPMEGFNPAAVDEILGLAERHLTATTMFAIGHRGEDPYAAKPKVRRSFTDVVEVVK